MIDSDVSGILSRETPGEPTGIPTVRELSDAKVGPITLVYQVVFASQGNEQLTDTIGRPILRVEGFVAKGRRRQLFEENTVIISEQILPQVHGWLEQNFLEFWNTDSINPPVQRSVSFSTGFEVGPSPKRGGWLLGGTSVTLLGIIATTLFVWCPWCPDFRLTSSGIKNSLIQQQYT